MSGYQKMNYDEAMDAIAKIKKNASELENILSKVSSDMNTLPNSYTGGASDEILISFENHRKEFPNFVNAIEDFGNKFKFAADTRRSLDESQAKRAGNL